MFFSVKYSTKKSINTIIGHNNARQVYSNVPIQTHAEIDCLKQIKYNYINTKKIKTYNLLIIRITSSGKIRCAKPCYHCAKQLREAKYVKIKNLYYSDTDGNIICEKFNNLSQSNFCHVSSGYRYRMKITKIIKSDKNTKEEYIKNDELDKLAFTKLISKNHL